MSYGLRIWNPSGVLVFDSTLAVGGLPVGFWAGGAGVLSFPEYAGRTMQALNISGAETFATAVPVSISYGPGYPVVTVDSAAPTFMLAVF